MFLPFVAFARNDCWEHLEVYFIITQKESLLLKYLVTAQKSRPRSWPRPYGKICTGMSFTSPAALFVASFVFDLPREIWSHAVVFTSNRVQAFWLIEGLPLGANARPKPIRFAQSHPELLRQAGTETQP